MKCPFPGSVLVFFFFFFFFFVFSFVFFFFLFVFFRAQPHSLYRKNSPDTKNQKYFKRELQIFLVCVCVCVCVCVKQTLIVAVN